MGKMFGTNGIRGVVNEDMNITLASKIGMAIGKVYGGRIAIGTDTRLSADMLKSAVSSGLMSVGVDVLDLGMLPTPALQYYVKTHNVTAGVVITASHNPPQFNGIKCISGDGTEASHNEEERIEELYDSEIKTVNWECVGKLQTVIGADEDYIDAVMTHVDADKIRRSKLTVCLDCANGAAFSTSPLLLKKLNVRAITINSDPQGKFPGHNSEPVEENLQDLMRLTRETNADIGIAHDGDADRCVFISSDGSYVSGEESLALMAKIILSHNKGTVVSTVATSKVLEETTKAMGGKIEYTAVGSPKIARRMIEINAVFGGEGNGGLIFPDMQLCRDGAMAIAKMLECVASFGPISKQLSELPKYCMIKKKLDCPVSKKDTVMEHVCNNAGEGNIDRTDGIRIDTEKGWILIRPSGTEPICRIYSESKDAEYAKTNADRFESLMKEFLKN